MFWIVTFRSPISDLPVVTEITLLTPGDFQPAAAPAPTTAPASPGRTKISGLPSPSPEKAQFRRSQPEGEIALESQSDNALADRLEARLASMQRSGSAKPAGAATSLDPSTLFGTKAATLPGPGGAGSAPIKLTREGAGGSALQLSRGGEPAVSATLTPAAIAQGAKSEASAPAKPGDATAQRTIAGASLLGPVADRPVLFHSLPVYPEWAKREAVEGSVSLYFVVQPNGKVRENVVVQRTAGYGDFDENARVALRAWRFEPLKGGRTGDQWGTITFHFRLREAS
jgi:TonB family protein